MIYSKAFWSKDAQAPLMNRNAHYLVPAHAQDAEDSDKDGETPKVDIRARTKEWVKLADAEDVDLSTVHQLKEGDETDRIFQADAERTFISKENQEIFTKNMQRLYHTFGKDYHQGLGYCYSFLALTQEPDDVNRILVKLYRDDKYIPGYWKAAPENFKRDAMVYGRLIEKHFPEVAKHLKTAGVVPEAYTQKWFVGLCLHVLPFPALFDFWEAFFRDGYLFLFQFALALVETLAPKILESKTTDVSKLFELLRLDVHTFPDNYQDGQFFLDLVASATDNKYKIAKDEIEELRKEEMEKLQIELEKVRKRLKELEEESDDEIIFSDEEDEESEEDDDDDDDEKKKEND